MWISPVNACHERSGGWWATAKGQILADKVHRWRKKKKKERNTVNPTGVEGKRKKKDNRRLNICPPVAGDYFGASGVGMRQFLLLVPGKQKAESDLGGRRGAAGADQTWANTLPSISPWFNRASVVCIPDYLMVRGSERGGWADPNKSKYGSMFFSRYDRWER